MRPYTWTRWSDLLKDNSRLEAGTQSMDPGHTWGQKVALPPRPPFLSTSSPVLSWLECLLMGIINLGWCWLLSTTSSGVGLGKPDLKEVRLAIVLVCYCRCNKLPQTQSLKTTQVYYLTILQVRSLKLNSVSAKLCSLLEALGDVFFLPFPASRGCPHSWACGPFCQGQQRPFFLTLHHSATLIHIKWTLLILWSVG